MPSICRRERIASEVTDHGTAPLTHDRQSYLECRSGSVGRFHGELDIKTLGGAGFASQRTTDEEREWDLERYAGVVIDVAEADGKSS